MRFFLKLYIFLIFIFGCSLPKFSIIKKDIKLGTLKTNGFYCNKSDFTAYLLYNNGVVMGGFSHDEHEINAIKRHYSDSSLYKNDYTMPYAWGLFEIIGDTIKIEKWESREWAAYGVSKYSGVVINESTFFLIDPKIGRDTFYFYYLPIKPDSTNKFIK